MNNHKTVNININNQTIAVDQEMANIIIALNDLGYKTSGCCIGENTYRDDDAWIIIQETNEVKIAELMKRLNDCSYTLSKDLYKKSSDNTIYVQYRLATPKGDISSRLAYIDDWFNKLTTVIINPVQTIDYKCMEKLFETKWFNISPIELLSDYQDNWRVQYKFQDLDIWVDYDMVDSSLKSLIALTQMNAEWRYSI